MFGGVGRGQFTEGLVCQNRSNIYSVEYGTFTLKNWFFPGWGRQDRHLTQRQLIPTLTQLIA